MAFRFLFASAVLRGQNYGFGGTRPGRERPVHLLWKEHHLVNDVTLGLAFILNGVRLFCLARAKEQEATEAACFPI